MNILLHFDNIFIMYCTIKNTLYKNNHKKLYYELFIQFKTIQKIIQSTNNTTGIDIIIIINIYNISLIV
ncbi:hypothetical protein FDZ61_01345 [Ehrlichia ruminantium]|uniref:Uncharacterized protein n=1 Tax=Ehrlichia ruminantium (strain Welgevonden) TaxID=254945 RepID=A0A0H3LYV7_EHRRW|nr:hypothetical protein FDZ65_01335 [Ehrlichia ruminantium]CAI26733.1 Hypothetical protein ERWE_CDS_02390 [Ehrlichia ruminantium str. Welgevonden]QLK53994.1 hypothetical protein FDZ63_01330 [Ehrlichia ruminantium]QLK54912.1 hypothetical protein FDZ62_01345 [Ehrlichia ruminantium]QLK55829.1 hypothetical protein FDZ61_01345 [Ehrlichia ruminantium]